MKAGYLLIPHALGGLGEGVQAEGVAPPPQNGHGHSIKYSDICGKIMFELRSPSPTITIELLILQS